MMLTLLLFIGLLNLALSIAIAGTLVKLINSEGLETQAQTEAQERNLIDISAGPYHRMENGELVQVGRPTYDMDVLGGKAEPYADGLLIRPSTKNWDGISQRN
jgi:hypothetical protein